MPEILVLPSLATRRTYPLHLRIVCALVARLADLQVSMQHAHTARLVRDFPKKYCPVEALVKDVEAQQSQLRADYVTERMQVQRDGNQIKVVDILSSVEQDFQRMRAEVAQLLEDELSGNEVPRKENPSA